MDPTLISFIICILYYFINLTNILFHLNHYKTYISTLINANKFQLSSFHKVKITTFLVSHFMKKAIISSESFQLNQTIINSYYVPLSLEKSFVIYNDLFLSCTMKRYYFHFTIWFLSRRALYVIMSIRCKLKKE